MQKNWGIGTHWQITFSTEIKTTSFLKLPFKKSTITLQFYDPKFQLSFLYFQDAISEPYKQKKYWSGNPLQ